jgi:hypothetical protein
MPLSPMLALPTTWSCTLSIALGLNASSTCAPMSRTGIKPFGPLAAATTEAVLSAPLATPSPPTATIPNASATSGSVLRPVFTVSRVRLIPLYASLVRFCVARYPLPACSILVFQKQLLRPQTGPTALSTVFSRPGGLPESFIPAHSPVLLRFNSPSWPVPAHQPRLCSKTSFGGHLLLRKPQVPRAESALRRAPITRHSPPKKHHLQLAMLTIRR